MATTPPSASTPARVGAVASFVAILGWLSVVIGIGAINLIVRPWCAPGSDCELIFWPRLLIAAIGGIAGFILVGYGLANAWQGRRLGALIAAGVLTTMGTGVWFWPVISG